MRECLAQLMTRQEKEALAEQISAALDDNDEDDMADFVHPTAPLAEGQEQVWGSGVEKWEHKSSEELIDHLGCDPVKMPWCQSVIDLENREDPWKTTLILDAPLPTRSSSVVPLGLKQHQLVGVAAMVENVFEGRVTLEMDAVGLGKTITVAMVWSVLRMYRENYARHGRFMGAYSRHY